jgi:hypothetical protein
LGKLLFDVHTEQYANIHTHTYRYAAASGCESIVLLLLKNGADRYLCDFKNRNAIAWATRRLDRLIAKMIDNGLYASASAPAKSNKPMTPLAQPHRSKSFTKPHLTTASGSSSSLTEGVLSAIKGFPSQLSQNLIILRGDSNPFPPPSIASSSDTSDTCSESELNSNMNDDDEDEDDDVSTSIAPSSWTSSILSSLHDQNETADNKATTATAATAASSSSTVLPMKRPLLKSQHSLKSSGTNDNDKENTNNDVEGGGGGGGRGRRTCSSSHHHHHHQLEDYSSDIASLRNIINILKADPCSGPYHYVKLKRPTSQMNLLQQQQQQHGLNRQSQRQSVQYNNNNNPSLQLHDRIRRHTHPFYSSNATNGEEEEEEEVADYDTYDDYQGRRAAAAAVENNEEDEDIDWCDGHGALQSVCAENNVAMVVALVKQGVDLNLVTPGLTHETALIAAATSKYLTVQSENSDSNNSSQGSRSGKISEKTLQDKKSLSHGLKHHHHHHHHHRRHAGVVEYGAKDEEEEGEEEDEEARALQEEMEGRGLNHHGGRPSGSSDPSLSSRGALDVLKLLLDHPKCEVDLKDSKGYTALMHAAMAGHEAAVLCLLQAGADR